MNIARTALFLTSICLVVMSAHAEPNIVSRPVGFMKITIDPQEEKLVAIPFYPFDESINAILKDQLTGADTESTSDRATVWKPIENKYQHAYKADGTDEPSIDGKWFTDFQNLELSDITITPGQGIIIENRQAETQSIVFVGEVILDKSMTVKLYPGFTLFGYPFTTSINFEDAGLAEESELVGGEMRVGAGYWYEQYKSSVIVWKEDCPYEDIFPDNGQTPIIEQVGLNADGDNITLSVNVAGLQNSKIDIYYQDISETNGFGTTGAWKAVVLDLAIGEERDLQWFHCLPEDESIKDSQGFCYLVGRADIDTDEDGVPDARELFLYQTNPNVAESHDEKNSDDTVSPLPIVTNPEVGPSGDNQIPQARSKDKMTIHVNVRTGDDRRNGRSRTKSGVDEGPKKSIRAGFDIAQEGDTLIVHEGMYKESIDFGSKDINVSFEGNVVIW